mmetsp:Transcript_38876/g.59077  ORF Transcript_38876/g.59077 Transcript_38876/m.59077 type:complete len:86 (+) Transcript_38876:671-928(+)|eukprot:CAMPEP_0170498408 /NCGR_PEP_ID=MMETSP0208-20121228/27749_1 /TAXON_ID=197538 /ORGANISM="Strombidium inclinatum, Strain S3" /LENGTH=85 /DNA_ID=CAMNT_0010775573 /DNA_START=616 /DNA_END=873 /DNA_ORIENTATION=-
MSKSAYATKWLHNDQGKPHSYYKERLPLRLKNRSIGEQAQFSGHPFSSLSANIMSSENNKTIQGVVQRQQELYTRQKLIEDNLNA